MTITHNVAERAGGMIRVFGTPEAALHQGRVQLQALGGYTDRELEKGLLGPRLSDRQAERGEVDRATDRVRSGRDGRDRGRH